VRGTLPSLWPMYISSAISTYLRAQTIPQASVYATWISNVLHIGGCYLFIVHLKMGAFGAGLAFSVTQTFSFLFLLGYVHFVRPGVTQKSWIGWDWKASTSNLRGFLDKALPCAMLMWVEWWCAELMTLMAGYLGVAALAAHTAVLQVFVLIYMTSGGISCAGAALVGNAVGEGSADLAKRSAFITLAVMLFACSVIDVIVYWKSESICNLFTEDAGVREQLMVLLRILLIVVPLDSLQAVIDGVLRGLGKQAVAFKVKLCCMWGVRIPAALFLGFHTELGIAGIWWGSAAGLAFTMAIYVLLILRIDWEVEIGACDIAYRQLSASGQEFSRQASTEFIPVPGFCRQQSNTIIEELEDEDEC